MSASSHALDDRFAAYLRDLSLTAEDPVLADLRAATAPLELARMQISPEQGRFMSLLTAALGVRRAIEIGVFTGYSSLCIAKALPADGTLVALDVSEEWTRIAREHWRRAGVEARIDLRLGPAQDSLQAMLEHGEAGTYDQAFVDADKDGYPEYYELCLALLRPGGVLAFDNAFLGGRVMAPEDETSKRVTAMNQRAFEDDRVDAALLPIGDGLLLLRKL